MIEEILNHFSYLDIEFICGDAYGWYFYFPPIQASFPRPRVMVKINTDSTMNCYVHKSVCYNKNTLSDLVCNGKHAELPFSLETIFNETATGFIINPEHFRIDFDRDKFASPGVYKAKRQYTTNDDRYRDINWLPRLQYEIEVFVEPNIILL